MQQLSSIIDFDRIQSQKEASNTLNEAFNYINHNQKGKPDKQSAKRRSHEFLTLIHNHIQSQKSPSTSKFYTLYILKLITEKDDRVILSVLTSHSLLKYLTFIAKTTDAYLPLDQKGKNLFSDKKLGNDYIRLILQSLKVWSEKFSSNKKNQSSHFKKAYDELIQRNIVLPSQLKFYNSKVFLSVGVNSQLPGRQNPQIKTQNKSMHQTIKQELSQLKSQNTKIMQYDINKINEFIQKLEGNEYEKYCHDYHKLFTKQKDKYQAIINQLVTSSDEKAMNNALAVNEFYIQESNAYKEFLTNKEDYYSYVNLIKVKADELNATITKTPQAKQLLKKEVTVEVKTRKNNLIDQKDGENKQIVSKLINKLNEKSKYQATSFKQIKQSLSKDKSLGRVKRSLSGLKKSSISRFGKSMTKSRMAAIFINPPNPYPQQKRYQGQIIKTNQQLETIMKDITKNQGLRRFITSNFKSKNPLFQNSHIQIGFKSQAIYQEVNEFQNILSIELYIGNKTDDEIINLSIQYKGNPDVLLYGNPKNIQTHLSPGFQTKHQLLIAPLNNKPSFIKMYLKYQINGQCIQEKIIVPNSIIKLSENGKLTKKQFVQNWNASTIFKTNEFKLTRYIAPDSLSKYIVSLSELSSYDQFLEQGSEVDFELGCQVILKRRYEGVLRISIRPNLNAVIQIGITDNTQQAYQGFIYYTQTLQMLLSHTDHQI